MQVCATYIDVAPFAGAQGHIVVHDTSALGLETCWQVGQGARVDQLLQSGCRSLGQTTDQVQEAKAVCAGTLDEQVVDVVLLASVERIALFPVAAHANHIVGDLVDGDDVGQADACCFAVLILVLKAFQVQINLELQQRHFFFGGVWLHAIGLVDFLLDHALRGFAHGGGRCGVEVLTADNGFLVVVDRHEHAVRDARAFAHHR